MVHVIRSIDAHVGGAAVRLLIDGVPRPAGKTMAQKREWMKRHATQLRRGVILEPRGHADLQAAMLTEPVSPGADAGILFMDADAFVPLSGAAVIAAATIAIEKGLIVGSSPRLTFDTVAGAVHAAARLRTVADHPRVDTVVYTGVPSFVAAGGHLLRPGTRELRVDLAFSGELYAIVDSEATGIPLGAATLPELRRLAAQVRAAANADGGVMLPHGRETVAGVVFTGPPQDPEAHLRNVTIAASGAADRSASANGTAAVMAVLDAMGLLADEAPFVHEGIAGTLHRGRVGRRTQVGDMTAIVPEIEGSAWITGEHVFYMDDDDPFKDGIGC
jgi:proline racemase